MTDSEAIERPAASVEERFGPIDVWINSAMATIFAPVREISPEEYRRASEVTYLGTVWGTMAALRRMAPRNRGAIVQVGSALAYRGVPLQAPYCGAKHAVQGFTESLRAELIHDRIDVRLTMVQLPAHNTPQFSWGRTKMPGHPQPVPPIIQPEVAARAIEYAAHNRRRQIYVAWPAVKAILADKVAPGLLDRMLGRTGYRDQQLDEPVERGRPDNLFEPAPGEWAAHGRFDDRALDRSALLWVNLHRQWLGLAVGAGTALAGLLAPRRTR